MTTDTLSLLLPLFIGIIVGALSYFFLFVKKRLQKKTSPSLELTPNCLLTRFPILFLTEPAKLPHENSLFDLTFQMLTEHGYKTEWVKIPTDPQQNQFGDLLKELELEHQKFHLFIDPKLLPTFNEVAGRSPVAQKVIISTTPLDFAEPRLALNRSVELAEQDFIGSSIQ